MRSIEWTPAMDAQLHAWATQEPPLSLSKQARDLGVSHGSIAKRRKTLGITSDHAGTRAATEAKSIDAAARRAALEQRHIDRIEHLLTRLESPEWQTLIKDVGGAELTRTLDFVPPRDEKDTAASIVQHYAALERIHRMNPDSGNAAAISMLGGIAKLIEQAAEGMPDEGPQ